jgi:oxalate decarboxylase/phosphoglucose isomerase-like protein (cupin superfamily)
MHVHHREQEMFRILSGQFRFWCAGEVQDLSDGDTVLIPRGLAHTFKNVGTGDGQLLITMTPRRCGGVLSSRRRAGGSIPRGTWLRSWKSHPATTSNFVGPPPA